MAVLAVDRRQEKKKSGVVRTTGAYRVRVEAMEVEVQGGDCI